MKIGLIVGSLRKNSWNRKVAEVVQEMLSEYYEAEFIDISNVPLYNADLDGSNPLPAYTEVREKAKEYDGYIFFTPEYNRSYSPVLKNVIDVVSIDPKGSAWSKKPVAVFSASIGTFGGIAGNLALRQSFSYVDLIPMQQPEVFLSNIHTFFDENGQMVESTKAYLEKAVRAYVEHFERFAK